MYTKNNNILILGGCGYVGSVLSNFLSEKGYKITVIDSQWFGKNIKENKNLKIIKKDIRKLDDFSFKKFKTIIHLANIANDPSVELNPNLSWEVNVFSTYSLITKSIKDGVSQFIYASSGSVYGVKKEREVTEDLELKPVSIYNKTKMISERILMSFKDQIKVHCIRPATVCGLSPRMRFDVSVNLLTYQALSRRKMVLFGGQQIRPNIHIKDLVNVYYFFLRKNIPTGFYNAGFENLSIKKISEKINKFIPSKIITKKVIDIRSYRQSSKKIIQMGFKPKYTVENAILEIKKSYSRIKIKNKKINNTVLWMKKNKIK
jgi:nucleoside-diphosphate-sugar epimerase